MQKKVLFFQHSNHNGGAPRSLKQIVKAYENRFGPQTVLFIRAGAVLDTYKDVKSKVVCGKTILPFHGSEVSGMSWKLAVRNILGLLTVPHTYFKYVKGYDVIYLNSSALCFHGLMARWFSPKGTRIVYHIREPLLDGFWGDVIRWCLRNSGDYALAISKNELTNLELPNLSSQVVYNYVHTDEYVVSKGESLHRIDDSVGKDKFVVGYFARVDKKNGIVDFLEVAKRFSSDPNVAFCVYGYTGDEKGGITNLIENSAPNVFVYPLVSDVPKNLCDLDVLLVPFKAPHFSRSVVEAAMLAVPSIIYDIVSVNETVIDGETGYVVPLGDVSSMANRVQELYENPSLLSNLGRNAKCFAEENFSEKNYELIEKVINAGNL